MRSPRRSKLIAGLLFALPAAFASSTATAQTGIYVMKADGGGERQVISIEGARSHTSPRWSHDGRRLAFDVRDAGGMRKSFVVNVDGTERKEVGDLGRPDWSPDDKQLILDNDDWTTSTMFVQNVDGDGRTELIGGAWPRWSPDGSKIAYCDGTLLKVLDLEDESEITVCGETFVQRPGAFDWSKDGKRLALFTRSINGGTRELYIVDANGNNDELKPRYSRPGMVGAHISWSPDDKRLFFTVDSVIHVLDVEGDAKPRLLPNQTDKNRDPAVSPDGKWIAFARRSG